MCKTLTHQNHWIDIEIFLGHFYFLKKHRKRGFAAWEHLKQIAVCPCAYQRDYLNGILVFFAVV